MSEAKANGGGTAGQGSDAANEPAAGGTSAPLAGAAGGADLQADLKARLAAVRERRTAAGLGPNADGAAAQGGGGMGGGGMGGGGGTGRRGMGGCGGGAGRGR